MAAVAAEAREGQGEGKGTVSTPEPPAPSAVTWAPLHRPRFQSWGWGSPELSGKTTPSSSLGPEPGFISRSRVVG